MSIYSDNIRAWIEQNNVQAEFLTFDNSVHTVEEAVKVSGHGVERFTKSMVMLTPAEEIVIAMVPADSRASTERVRKALQLKERPRIVTAEESEKHLGQQVGGNSPLNASKAKILIDPKVLEKDWILTGGGDNRSLVRIPVEELKRRIEYTEVRVRK